MGEILFLCGSNERAVIATLNAIGHDTEDCTKDEVSLIRSDINVSSFCQVVAVVIVLTFAAEFLCIFFIR